MRALDEQTDDCGDRLAVGRGDRLTEPRGDCLADDRSDRPTERCTSAVLSDAHVGGES